MAYVGPRPCKHEGCRTTIEGQGRKYCRAHSPGRYRNPIAACVNCKAQLDYGRQCHRCPECHRAYIRAWLASRAG